MDRRRMTTTTRLHASLPTLLARLALALTVSLALASPASAFEQKLTASDGAALDQLGYSVAIDGDTLVAGAIGDDAAQGAVYVFQRSGGSWVFNAKLTASDGAANDFLGTSVAIDGDTIVVGASGETATTLEPSIPLTRTGPADAHRDCQADRLGRRFWRRTPWAGRSQLRATRSSQVPLLFRVMRRFGARPTPSPALAQQPVPKPPS